MIFCVVEGAKHFCLKAQSGSHQSQDESRGKKHDPLDTNSAMIEGWWFFSWSDEVEDQMYVENLDKYV